MNTLGGEIRRALRAKGWTYADLAREAAAVPGAPRLSQDQMRQICTSRVAFRVDDETEPLPFVMRALGLGPEVLIRAFGLGNGTGGEQ